MIWKVILTRAEWRAELTSGGDTGVYVTSGSTSLKIWRGLISYVSEMAAREGLRSSEMGHVLISTLTRKKK